MTEEEIKATEESTKIFWDTMKATFADNVVMTKTEFGFLVGALSAMILLSIPEAIDDVNYLKAAIKRHKAKKALKKKKNPEEES